MPRNPWDRKRRPGAPSPGGNKYRARRTLVGDLAFDSKHEAVKWIGLVDDQRRGKIRNLQRQVPIPLHAAGGDLVGHYRADFVYEEYDEGREIWVQVIADAKGVRTDLYSWKARHVQAEYHCTIREM